MNKSSGCSSDNTITASPRLETVACFAVGSGFRVGFLVTGFTVSESNRFSSVECRLIAEVFELSNNERCQNESAAAEEDESDRCQNIDWYFSVIFVQDLDEAH